MADRSADPRPPARSGYHASRAKVCSAPVARLYQAWTDAALRARWLPDPGFTVLDATPDRSLLIAWIDGSSEVEAVFTVQGEGRSQVSVDHTRLSDAADVAGMRAYWAEALDRLHRLLGG